MGRAIIGGVITSTLLTLVVVPVIYTYLDGWSQRRIGRRAARRNGARSRRRGRLNAGCVKPRASMIAVAGDALALACPCSRLPVANRSRRPGTRVTSRANTCASPRRLSGTLVQLAVERGAAGREGCAAVHAGERAGTRGARGSRSARAPGAGDARQSREGAPATGNRGRARAARAGAGVAAPERGGSRAHARSSSPTSSCRRNSATRRSRRATATARASPSSTEQVQIANLPARSDEIAAATAEVKAAGDALAQAQWRVEQKSQTAPVGGSRRRYALSSRRMGRRRRAGRVAAAARQREDPLLHSRNARRRRCASATP